MNKNAITLTAEDFTDFINYLRNEENRKKAQFVAGGRTGVCGTLKLKNITVEEVTFPYDLGNLPVILVQVKLGKVTMEVKAKEIGYNYCSYEHNFEIVDYDGNTFYLWV